MGGALADLEQRDDEPRTLPRLTLSSDFSRGRPPRGLVFDPHAPVIGALGPNGDLYLRLGGTVMPARTQPGGDYRGTIFMTVYDLGI